MSSFQEVGLHRLVSFFLGRIVCFLVQLKMDILQGLKPLFLLFLFCFVFLLISKLDMGVYNLKKKNEQKNYHIYHDHHLETDLLKIRHMLRPIF